MPTSPGPKSLLELDQKKQPQRAESETNFEPLLNDAQAARMLGNMHPRTLQRLARSHVVPGIKIGNFGGTN
jgi:hypothetical protein